MSPEMIGLFGFIAIFILMAISMPLGFAMALIGLIGNILLVGVSGAFMLVGTSPILTVAHYEMSVIPLFVFMGAIAHEAGMTKDAYSAARVWLGRVPGGLAVATIIGSAAFSACTGSSVASISVIAGMALPEMKRYGYDVRLATGSIASGATLAVMIPPSIPLIIYGMLAEASIGKLFIAGVFPGLLLTGLFVVTIILVVTLDPSKAPTGPKVSFREKLGASIYAWPLLLLILIIFGGIWGGIFTAIESAGVAAFCALLIGLIYKRLNKEKILTACKDALRVTTMLFLVLIGAMLFKDFIALSRLPMALANFVGELSLSANAVVAVIMIFYVIGGCVVDLLGLMFLTLPIFIPIIDSIGYDVILFGVLTTVCGEMAMITPPIGINVFVLNAAAKDVPMEEIFRGVLPFIGAVALFLVLLMIFPQISLFLPATMMK